MPNDRLDYFILAYESPTFSAAAARVPMSPQGLSKAIRGLEKELDVTLFVTDADGQRHPTSYADRFYDYALSVRRERALLKRSFDQLSNAGVVDVQMAASLGVVGLLEHDLNEAFRRRCPEVRLTLVEMPDDDCERFVSEGLYRCGLLVSPARGDLVFHEAYATSVHLWVHRSNPLFNREVLSLEDLVGQTIAMPGHGFKCYRRLVMRMEDANLPLPEIVERSELIWIYEEVAHGRALGFSLPYMDSLAAFSHNNDVRSIPVEGSRWGFGIVYDREPDLSSFEAILGQCACECAAQLPKS